MHNNIVLGVYRRLDNRLEGLPDDSPRALQLHNLRRDALHAALDGDPAIKVIDWQLTDDKRPHEFVELTLGAVAAAAFQYLVVPGIQWLGRRLLEKSIDTAIAELVKAVIAKCRPAQQSKQLLDIVVTLPDGTRISVDPPDRQASITIQFANGSLQSINYLIDDEDDDQSG